MTTTTARTRRRDTALARRNRALAARNTELDGVVAVLFADKQRYRTEAATAHEHQKAAARSGWRHMGRAELLKDRVAALTNDLADLQALHRGVNGWCGECDTPDPCLTYDIATRHTVAT